MNKPEIHIGVRVTFFSGGGGAQPIAEYNFEHLEPLDCRKQRFQGLNFTFFGTLVQEYCLILRFYPYSSDFWFVFYYRINSYTDQRPTNVAS